MYSDFRFNRNIICDTTPAQPVNKKYSICSTSADIRTNGWTLKSSPDKNGELLLHLTHTTSMTPIAKHRKWKQENILTVIQETSQLWTQCVALAKKYYKDVYWVDTGSFNGSAINGWEYLKNNPKLKRIANSATFKPRYGDMWFFQIGTYWHVFIVDEFSTITRLFVIENNWGNWDGKGRDDLAQVRAYDYITPKFLWVYRVA